MKTALVLVVFLLSLTSAKPFFKSSDFTKDVGDVWIHCSQADTGFQITSVNIPGCTAPPCTITRGTNASISVTFKATADFASGTNKVSGKVLGVNVPFPLPKPSICDDGVQCPMKSGQSYTESVTIPIKSEYPKVKAVVTWTMYDPSGNQQGCFEVELQLQ